MKINNKYNQKLPHFYVMTKWIADYYFFCHPLCHNIEMWKLLVILVVIKLYAQINIFKCENEDDLNLFLNRPNFIWNGIIIPVLLVKAIFFASYSPEGISFSPSSINIGALAKILILTTQIFLLLVLWNNYSLNVSNFRCL